MDGKTPLIIDSNVVLNWLFFNDAPTVALVDQLLKTHCWVCTEWMAREAQRVATLPQLAKYATPAATAALADGFVQHATVVECSTVSTHPALRCRDADDQAFLDLAAHTHAPLLLTLDKDLLKLQKRAKTFGLNIVQPFKITL